MEKRKGIFETIKKLLNPDRSELRIPVYNGEGDEEGKIVGLNSNVVYIKKSGEITKVISKESK